VNARRIYAVDQWCLRTLLGIKWHQFVRSDEMRITKQPGFTAIIQLQHLSIFWAHCTYDDAAAKMILTAPPPDNWRHHQGFLVSHGWTPYSETWEPTTSHWMKQSTWLRTVLCGGWCLCMVLCTPRGACQKRRRRL